MVFKRWIVGIMGIETRTCFTEEDKIKEIKPVSGGMER
jgi:hypothetical protein